MSPISIVMMIIVVGSYSIGFGYFINKAFKSQHNK